MLIYSTGFAKSSYLQANIPAIYKISFNNEFFNPVLSNNKPNKIGEITITCNATEFHLKYYTSDSNYLYNNQSWLVYTGGSINNAYHRLAYKVYFNNNESISHTPPESFPQTKEKATIPTPKSSDNHYVFQGLSPTVQGKYDVNIVVDESQLQSVIAGDYKSTLTFVLTDS